MFACLDRLKEGKGWFENVSFCKIRKAPNHSDCRIPESAIPQVRINEWTWFLASRCQFKKNNMGKKGLSQSNFQILKSAISQQQMGHSVSFFCMLINNGTG